MAATKAPLEPAVEAWFRSHGLTPDAALSVDGGRLGALVRDSLLDGDEERGRTAFAAFQWVRDSIDDPEFEWLSAAEAAIGLSVEDDDEDDAPVEGEVELIDLEWKDPQ